MSVYEQISQNFVFWNMKLCYDLVIKKLSRVKKGRSI